MAADSIDELLQASSKETEIDYPQGSAELLELCACALKGFETTSIFRPDWDVECHDQIDVLLHQAVYCHENMDSIESGTVELLDVLASVEDNGIGRPIASVIWDDVDRENSGIRGGVIVRE